MVIDQLERIWKEAIVASSRYYSGTSLEAEIKLLLWGEWMRDERKPQDLPF
jgi:hypothetical protein